MRRTDTRVSAESAASVACDQLPECFGFGNRLHERDARSCASPRREIGGFPSHKGAPPTIVHVLVRLDPCGLLGEDGEGWGQNRSDDLSLLGQRLSLSPVCVSWAGQVHGLRLRTEEGRIRASVVIGSISVLLVVGGAAGATYFVQAHRRTTVTLHRTSGARASHPPVFDVVASSPATGQHAVTFAPLIRVQFSRPLARRWSRPTLTPMIPGSWMRIGPAMLEFRPKANFVPSTNVTLAIRAGKAGMRDDAGVVLTRSYRASFVIAGGSVLRLQQLLAELGYLPLDFEGATSVTPGSSHTVARAVPLSPPDGAAAKAKPGVKGSSAASSQSTTTTSSQPSLAGLATATLDREATTPDAIGLAAEPGSFSWRYPSIPSSLATTWQPGVDTALVRGSVMAFESAHGLPADGDAGPEVWVFLLKAVAQRQVSSAPYDYLGWRLRAGVNGSRRRLQQEPMRLL